MPIVVHIDVELAKRRTSVGEFAEKVGLTPANVAVLKDGPAKAVLQHLGRRSMPHEKLRSQGAISSFVMRSLARAKR